MKKFNIKEYLANPLRKVVTRDGHPVRILCTDAKGKFPVVAIFGIDDEEDSVGKFQKDGMYNENEISPFDLFFPPEKREGWINIYKPDVDCARTGSVIFDSKEDAIRCVGRDDYVGTIHIEW